MQPSSNIRRDSTNSELKNNNENHDDIQAPPPTYRSFIDKLENYGGLPSHPPSYTDINNPAVIYINNYPGPPATDGVVQIITSNYNSTRQENPIGNFLSKKMRIYLAINGALTIFFGLTTIGLQIGLLVLHSILYYYYGFWAGALIISVGINTIMFNTRYHIYDLDKYFRSFIWQTVFITVVFGFGIIIISTDTCDDSTTLDTGNDNTCKHSYKILNGFLVTVIVLTFLQSIINTLFIGCLKRLYVINSNVVS